MVDKRPKKQFLPDGSTYMYDRRTRDRVYDRDPAAIIGSSLHISNASHTSLEKRSSRSLGCISEDDDAYYTEVRSEHGSSAPIAPKRIESRLASHFAKDRLVKVSWISFLGTASSMPCSAKNSWHVTLYFAEQDDGQIGKSFIRAR